MLTFERVDFEEFHTRTLPLRIVRNGELAADDVADIAPFAVRLASGGAYTYVPTGGSVEIRAGDDAARTVIEFEPDAFSDYANELQSCFGLVYGTGARLERGSFDDWFRWEPAIRALYAGRPLYDGTAAANLDLSRSFTLDDSDEEIGAFLSRAGFAHLRGVFTADEIANLVAEVDRLSARARPDDGASWWTTVDGVDACCRLIYSNRGSAAIAVLADDARIRRLHALGGPGLVPELDCLDGISVVIKQPRATTGLADLPWHQDCGLGGHPVLCPSVGVGIQLDRASAETGQLHFLAGSHLGSSHQLQPDDVARLPVVAVDADPGDVTVHYGHVLHAAPPPTGDGLGRRAMYVTACRPETQEFIGAGKGYNDVLFEGDGQVHSVDEIVTA
jgi:hypothetical protein